MYTSVSNSTQQPVCLPTCLPNYLFVRPSLCISRSACQKCLIESCQKHATRLVKSESILWHNRTPTNLCVQQHGCQKCITLFILCPQLKIVAFQSSLSTVVRPWNRQNRLRTLKHVIYGHWEERRQACVCVWEESLRPDTKGGL